MDDGKTMTRAVLVTGATGFIGQRVVARLLETNADVRALVLPDETPPSSWGEKVSVIRGSISDAPVVKKAAEGAGVIIHLAAVVSDWGDERLYWEFTVEGSRLVFDEALANDARVVLASSVVVYGDRVRTRSCPEETGYGATFGPYSRTKQAQEKLAWEYHHGRGMKLAVVRPANVYGPGSGPWLHDVVNVLKSGGPGLVGGGRMNAGLVYVDNVADILVLCATSDKALGRVYNACDGLSVTWNDYFTDIASMVGVKKPRSIPRPLAAAAAWVCETIWKRLNIRKRPPITREALNLVGSDNRFPNDRVKRELGYEPKVSYVEGLARTREYLKQAGLASRKPTSGFLSNKLAYITGGSSGIGLATARLLAEEGCDLVLLARDGKNLEQVCASLRKTIRPPQNVGYLAMDVSDNRDVDVKIREALDRFGVPDIVVNSAGVGVGDCFVNIGYEAFDRTMKINVYGTRNVIAAVLPSMRARKSGHLVNIASVAGLIGMYGYSVYGASKFALVGMSEALRSELKTDGIAVTLVCPPEVRTPLIEEEAKTLPAQARAVKSLAGLLDPEQVAKAIVKGIRKKTFLVIPGLAARFLYLNHRISNGFLTRFPSDLIVSLVSWRAGKKRNGRK